MEFLEGWGAAFKLKILPWEGYGFFLEQHNDSLREPWVCKTLNQTRNVEFVVLDMHTCPTKGIFSKTTQSSGNSNKASYRAHPPGNSNSFYVGSMDIFWTCSIKELWTKLNSHNHKLNENLIVTPLIKMLTHIPLQFIKGANLVASSEMAF